MTVSFRGRTSTVTHHYDTNRSFFRDGQRVGLSRKKPPRTPRGWGSTGRGLYVLDEPPAPVEYTRPSPSGPRPSCSTGVSRRRAAAGHRHGRPRSGEPKQGTRRARRAAPGCSTGPRRGGGSAGIRTQGGYEPHRLSRSAPSAARTRYLDYEVTRTLPRSPTRRPAVSVTTDIVPGRPGAPPAPACPAGGTPSAAVGEEGGQEVLGLLGSQAGAHLDLVVGAGVAHDVAH
mgnify:CR=1 FL=1